MYIFVDEWTELDGVPAWFADTVLRPALSVTFNERKVINAAEIMMYSHFYFTGDSKVTIVISSLKYVLFNCMLGVIMYKSKHSAPKM